MERIPEVTVQELAARLAGPEAERPVLLDVRWPREHEYVALPGSVLIPLDDLEERMAELEPHRARELVVYCHHGVRSLTGAYRCLEAGFKASSLEGGIDAWSAEIDPSFPRY